MSSLKFLPDHFLKSVTLSKSNKALKDPLLLPNSGSDDQPASSTSDLEPKSTASLVSSPNNNKRGYKKSNQLNKSANNIASHQANPVDHFSNYDEESSDFSEEDGTEHMNQSDQIFLRRSPPLKKYSNEASKDNGGQFRHQYRKVDEYSTKGNVSICKYCSSVSKDGNQVCCKESGQAKKQWVLGKSISIQQTREPNPKHPPSSRAVSNDRQKRKIDTSGSSLSKRRAVSQEEDSLKLCSYFICIGSYKIRSDSNVIFSSNGVRLVVPSVEDSSLCAVNIPDYCIKKVSYNYDEDNLIIFLDIVEKFCEKIRENIEMNNRKPYFSNDSPDPLERHIALFLFDASWSCVEDLYSFFKNRVQPTEEDGSQYINAQQPPQESTGPLQGTDTRLLTYPVNSNRAIKGAVTITTDDVKCLNDGQYLNDVIIDFYLKYLTQTKLSMSDKRHTHFFSTYFYKRLTRWSSPFATNGDDPRVSAPERRHNRVKNWTKDVDIFSKDFIIVPINDKSHWFLAVICFPGYSGAHCTTDGFPAQIQSTSQRHRKPEEKQIPLDDDESDLDEADSESEYEEDTSQEPIIQPSILVFDSLAGPSRGKVIATLREYLTMEYKLKRGGKKVFTPTNCKGSCPIVPQQDNFTDCGIYTLQYAESFFTKPVTDYSLPITELLDWFPQSSITGKRQSIAKIIEDLVKEHHPERVKMIPKLNASSDDQRDSSMFHEAVKRMDTFPDRRSHSTPKSNSRVKSPPFQAMNSSRIDADEDDVINIATPKKDYDIVIVDSPPKSHSPVTSRNVDELKASSDRFISVPPKIKMLPRPIPR